MPLDTNDLVNILSSTSPDNLDSFFDAQSDDLYPQEKPFAAFMKSRFEEKKISQRDMFLALGIPQDYGYRLTGERKRTKERDLILAMCFFSHFDLSETQTALRLYRFSPLYARMPRDAVLIKAIQEHIFAIDEVNTMLSSYGMTQLRIKGIS